MRIPEWEEVLEERRQKECTRKSAGYNSMQQAERAAKRMEERFPRQKFGAYKCIHCGTFHIGHIRMHNKLKQRS